MFSKNLSRPSFARLTSAVLALGVVLSPAAIAVADDKEEEEHFDVWLRIVDGTFVTGAISEGDPGDPITDRYRVFGAELGEDPQFPFSATEPGFQLLASEETIDAVLNFNAPSPMQVWTGDGWAATDAAMLIGFGPESVIVADTPIDGFQFSANDEGFIHDHFEYTLEGAGGADPEVGVYLLTLNMQGISPVIGTSMPFFQVFNNGAEEEEHEEAINWTLLNLACGADLNGDGMVNGEDVGILLGAWGSEDLAADLDGSGVVDAADLGLQLGFWGECPSA